MHSILVMLPVGRTGLKGKQNGQFQTFSNAENILYTEGMTHKDFRQCLANELLERSELQLNPNPSPGRPPRSSVRAEHCPVPLTSDHLAKKS